MALCEAEKESPPFILGSLQPIDGQASWRWHSRNADHNCSFLHWGAYWSQGKFVTSNCEAGDLKDTALPSDLADLNLLLLSASTASVLIQPSICF